MKDVCFADGSRLKHRYIEDAGVVFEKELPFPTLSLSRGRLDRIRIQVKFPTGESVALDVTPEPGEMLPLSGAKLTFSIQGNTVSLKAGPPWDPPTYQQPSADVKPPYFLPDTSKKNPTTPQRVSTPMPPLNKQSGKVYVSGEDTWFTPDTPDRILNPQISWPPETRKIAGNRMFNASYDGVQVQVEDPCTIDNLPPHTPRRAKNTLPPPSYPPNAIEATDTNNTLDKSPPPSELLPGKLFFSKKYKPLFVFDDGRPGIGIDDPTKIQWEETVPHFGMYPAIYDGNKVWITPPRPSERTDTAAFRGNQSPSVTRQRPNRPSALLHDFVL